MGGKKEKEMEILEDRESDESVLIELTETQTMETLISLQKQADNYRAVAEQMYANIKDYIGQMETYRNLGYNIRFFYDLTTREIAIEPEEKIIGFQQQRINEEKTKENL